MVGKLSPETGPFSVFPHSSHDGFHLWEESRLFWHID